MRVRCHVGCRKFPCPWGDAAAKVAVSLPYCKLKHHKSHFLNNKTAKKEQNYSVWSKQGPYWPQSFE